MPKIILNDITSGFASNTLYNANNAAIEVALDNTLSLDGTSPNAMLANLDMNGYGLLNAVSINGIDTTLLTNLSSVITDAAVSANASAASAVDAAASASAASSSAVASANSAVDADSSASIAASYSSLGLATGTVFDLGFITDLTIIFPTDWGTIV
jgi:hypothetical protein